MNASKSKKKRPLSGAPKGSALASLIPPKIVNPYGTKMVSSSRKSNKNSNSKVTQKSSVTRVHTSNYDFPEFAVYFKDNSKKGRTIDHSVLDMPKTSYREDTNRRNKIKGKERAKIANKTIANLSNRDTLKTINAKDKQNVINKPEGKSLQNEFRQAVAKIFKLLDIFNRGKISEANVNKWIPQSALYFLGSVFQKIKACRLSLSLQEFTGLCLPLLFESNQQDIKQFIKHAKIATHIKPLPNPIISEQSKTIDYEMSPIRKRMMIQQVQRNSSKKTTPRKNQQNTEEIVSSRKVQMEDVLNAIKNREDQMTDRLNQIKQKRKSVSFHNVLEEIHPNRIIQYDEPQSFQKVANSDHKIDKLSSYNSPQKPMLKSILKNSHRYTPPNVPINYSQRRNLPPSQNYQNQLNQFNSPVIANFTFNLPKEQPNMPEIQIKTANSIVECETKQSQVEEFLNLRLDRSETYEKSQSATKFSVCKEDLKYEVKSKTHRRQNDSDDVRIERLHSRIEEYMRRNADKLQRSRMFLQSQRNDGNDAVTIF